MKTFSGHLPIRASVNLGGWLGLLVWGLAPSEAGCGGSIAGLHRTGAGRRCRLSGLHSPLSIASIGRTQAGMTGAFTMERTSIALQIRPTACAIKKHLQLWGGEISACIQFFNTSTVIYRSSVPSFRRGQAHQQRDNLETGFPPADSVVGYCLQAAKLAAGPGRSSRQE
jgi:hypothetical protein